jgi:hypothetical protein
VKYKIGVYGSNITEGEEAIQLAQALGAELARHKVIVITGACSGMPYAVASAAKRQGQEWPMNCRSGFQSCGRSLRAVSVLVRVLPRSLLSSSKSLLLPKSEALHKPGRESKRARMVQYA